MVLSLSPSVARRRLRASTLAWELLNLKPRLLYRRYRPALGAVEAGAVKALAERGLALVHIDALFPPGRFAELTAYVAERLRDPAVVGRLGATPAARGERKGEFLVDLWPGEHRLDPGHPFLRFSLSLPVLKIVAAYLGMFPKFREFFLQVTLPVGSERSPFASQRWHADPDDRRMVKVFLYLNDVGVDAGPFTYILGSHGGGRWRHLFPFAPKQKSRHPDPAMIERTIPKDDIAVAAGRAGTIIFCDTSGIHRGGYATRDRRTMYTSVYTTRASFEPTRYTYAPSVTPAAMADPIARYAVDPH